MQSSKKITRGFIEDYISNSTQAALDLKAPLANPTFTGNVVVPNGDQPNEAVNKGQLDSTVSGAVSGTINYIPKFTSSNVLGDSQIIDNGTNVLIGTNTVFASEKLLVEGNIHLHGFFKSTSGFYTPLYTTSLGSRLADAVGILTLGNNGINEIRGGMDGLNGHINFYTNNSVGPTSASDGVLTMSLKQSGNVLIGTLADNIVDKLQVNGSARFQSVLIDNGGVRTKLNVDGTIEWGQLADAGRLTWDTGKAVIKSQAGKTLNLGANEADSHLIITTGGNVLINNPVDNTLDKLQVAGSVLTDGLRYGKGLIISGVDLDTFLPAGFYGGNSMTNAPDSGYFYLTQEVSSGLFTHQTATSFGIGNTANRIYDRVNVGGVWTSWAETITSNYRQNSMVFDGTGTFVPTVDAVNLQANNLLKVSGNTGFVDRLDPFNMVLTNPTTITITGSNPGAFIRTRLFAPPFTPSDAIRNITGRTYLASAITLGADGRYFRYIGYDYAIDSIVDSATTYLTADNIVALGFVEVKRLAGVNTFTAFQMQVDISTVSLLDNVMVANQATSKVSPNANLTINNTAGIFKASGINWGSLNPHIKVINANNPITFIRIDPAYTTTTAGYTPTTTVDTTTYWNGSALVSTGNNNSASVQRILLALDGRVFLQAAEQTFASLGAAQAAATTVAFTDIIPADLVVEVCRIASVKITSDLSNTAQAQFYYITSGGSAAGGGSASFSTIGGSPFDNAPLATELNARPTGSGTTNTLTKWTAGTVIGNSTITDTGSLITLGSNTTISTGNLTFGATLLSEKLLQMNNASLSTGLYNFASGGITMASATEVNIGAVQGWIVDSDDHLNSNPTFVNYAGTTNLTPTFIGSAAATYFLITPGSTLLQLNTRPTVTQRRDNIFLGVVGHPAGTLTGIGNSPDIIMNYGSQFRAMFEPTRLINEGVVPYAGAADLSLYNTAGKLYGLGIGFIANGNDAPSLINVAGGAPMTTQYRTSVGIPSVGGTNRTTAVPDRYESGGVDIAIPGSSNQATNQRIYLLQNGVIRFQYGQTLYATLADAIAGATNEAFVVNINAINLGILIGILSIQKGATNLQNTAQARFLPVSKFGETVGAAAGISIGTLQTAYNNSAEPELLTNSTLGALSIRRGSAADTDAVIQIQNNAGTTNFSVTGNGVTTAVSFVKTGATATDALMGTGVSTILTAGTYTPTLTNIANTSLLAVNGTCSYMRIGNIVSVTVAVSLSITTTATFTNFSVTLPINRATSTGTTMGNGAVTFPGTGVYYTAIATSTATTTVNISFYPPTGSGSVGASISFQYDVTS